MKIVKLYKLVISQLAEHIYLNSRGVSIIPAHLKIIKRLIVIYLHKTSNYYNFKKGWRVFGIFLFLIGEEMLQ
jgi:hypothetical protein